MPAIAAAFFAGVFTVLAYHHGYIFLAGVAIFLLTLSIFMSLLQRACDRRDGEYSTQDHSIEADHIFVG